MPDITATKAARRGDLGLAEADIAADQPVGGHAAGQIGDGVADGPFLVVGLGEREAGAELVEQALGRCQMVGFAQLAGGGDADQLIGHVADALLEPRLAGLPGGATQLVELHVALVGAIAAEHLNVLDRHEELVVAVIEQPQTVVRRAADLDGDQGVVAADAVIGVHHQVAGIEGRGVRDDVLGPDLGLAGRARQAFAEDVGLADDGDIWADEAALQAENGHGDPLAGHVGKAVPGQDGLGIADLVLAEQGGQAFAGALGEGGDDDPPSLPVLDGDLLAQGLEDGDAGLDAGIAEVTARATAGVGAVLGFRTGEGGQGGDRQFY